MAWPYSLTDYASQGRPYDFSLFNASLFTFPPPTPHPRPSAPPPLRTSPQISGSVNRTVKKVAIAP
ncbi:hypothetical protein [Planktothricoides raciborskii]|uniref:Uncharacterized protein n=1 Tax=Planktothricoides raciborskii FACHB-1370 TaxID=2949576 RepID=A0ABR8EM67_9CYAN|nr:hypothetical protein [Planktothricoides raciborskii]MBD2547863.1 hypothetical protein [Planktothricoides raciborskii FACHB-1370]